MVQWKDLEQTEGDRENDEEGELDRAAVEIGRFLVEADVAQVVAVAAVPAAVRPGAHHQQVCRAGRLTFGRAIDVQRAVKVFGIEPAADDHHRRADVLQMWPQISRLPELVVSAVPHQFVPESDLTLEMVLVGLLQRAQARPGHRCRA